MKRLSFFCLTLIFCTLSFTQDAFLMGTDTGLYDIRSKPRHIFKDVQIKKILHNEKTWLFLTDKGIISSSNLNQYKFLNKGLPQKTLKIEENGKFKLHGKMQALKDLEINPFDKKIFVTATNANVFLTINGGKSWQNLGNYGHANGIKAVAVTNLPDKNGNSQITVFVSHSIYGVAWKQPYVENIWTDITNGLAKGAEAVDEVSDIVIHKLEDGQQIFASQTFKNKLYELNWGKNKFEEITENTDSMSKSNYIDSLSTTPNYIVGLQENNTFAIPILVPSLKKYGIESASQKFNKVVNDAKNRSSQLFSQANCFWIGQKFSKIGSNVSLSELWLLRLNHTKNEYMAKANNRKGVYIPTYKLKTEEELEKYFQLLKDNNLNTIVVDMKDDFGFVRYDSNDILIKMKGSVRPFIQLENFVKKAKEQGIYLIARIVVFKDKQLYYYNRGAYAVKDSITHAKWQGYRTIKTKINTDQSETPFSGPINNENKNSEYEIERQYFQEYWVDPYNTNVWKYNTAIGTELVERGFDEIQFDYIRFPTDGDNLKNAYYPAKETEMDKETAIMSFLAYARNHIKAPISIDIYGANGWYRTGARTGQEVEMLTDYVDVICPMYYPSHFNQGFLAYPPAVERPYRIYHQGSLRNKYIARNKVIIRPWAQAFFINVSYDRKYYGKRYVHQQILGIKDSVDEGYTYWNTIGNYTNLTPDGTELNTGLKD